MTDIEVLEREKQCVKRKAATNCSDCARCDLLMDDAIILAAYDRAISALRAQQQPNAPLTNADRIRAMSDEELAQWLCNKLDCGICKEEIQGMDSPKPCVKQHVSVLEWLKQPAGEADHEQ